MNKNSLLFLIAVFIFVSCGSGAKKDPNKISGNITISGAFALYPLTVKWSEEFRKIYPDVRIDISAGGAGKGMADVLAGMVDIGMVSREVNPEEIKKGTWVIAVAKDAVIPVMNANNPLLAEIKEKGINKNEFRRIFIKNELNDWNVLLGKSSGFKMNIYTRSDACGAAEVWANFLGVSQENLNGIGVFGDPGIADAVKKDKYAIAYNNVNYAFDIHTRKLYEGIEAIPIDFNNNGRIDSTENFYHHLDSFNLAVKTGRYASPPARNLYFVFKGKPDNLLFISFLNWVLSDGQKFVLESGYVGLSAEELKAETSKILVNE